MEKWNTEPRVRLISQGFDTWKVQILFSDLTLSASEISDRLAEVKSELAKQFGVPNSLLEYNRLISRKQTRNGLLVQIQITKQALPAGAPRFRSMPLLTEDGLTFSDMRIEADLFPYDEFDHKLTRLTVEARLKTEGYDLECIVWPTVLEALQTMEQTIQPIRELEIGRGKIPSIGRSSRLTYGIGPNQDHMLHSAWLGLRPVRGGDFIVEVSNATGGHKWGRNVFGRELEPRSGIQTRLEALDGVRLAVRDSQLLAVRDGMLLLRRIGMDKRDRDSWNMSPAKLSARIVDARIFNEPSVFSLDLNMPAAFQCSLLAGSRITSSAPLFIQGDLEEGVQLTCADSVRIQGSVFRSIIQAGRHVCITGEIIESTISSDCTLQIDGHVVDSNLTATDVVAGEIHGGCVEALHQTSIDHLDDSGGAATAIRINLRKYLERQQVVGQEAITDLSNAILQIRDLFGAQITDQVTESSAQRLLLKWLRQQKLLGNGNYTHVEVQELRTVLEMIPLIRDQLKAMGVELRDVTARLSVPESDNNAPETAE
jgi:hypothetical protein